MESALYGIYTLLVSVLGNSFREVVYMSMLCDHSAAVESRTEFGDAIW